MKNEIEQLDNLIADNLGVVESLDILQALNDKLAKAWDDMCSELVCITDYTDEEFLNAALDKANEFLTAHESKYEAIGVELVDNLDNEYVWTFAAKFQKQLTDEQMAYMKARSMAKDAIDHHCDGPMTPLVAISRAMTLAASHAFDAELLSDALDQVLEKHGWVTDRTETTGTYQS